MSHGQSGVPTPMPVVRTLPDSTTANALRAEIVRLYRQLETYTQGHRSLPYLALESQIHALARQHWRLVDPHPRVTRVW